MRHKILNILVFWMIFALLTLLPLCNIPFTPEFILEFDKKEHVVLKSLQNVTLYSDTYKTDLFTHFPVQE